MSYNSAYKHLHCNFLYTSGPAWATTFISLKQTRFNNLIHPLVETHVQCSVYRVHTHDICAFYSINSIFENLCWVYMWSFGSVIGKINLHFVWNEAQKTFWYTVRHSKIFSAYMLLLVRFQLFLGYVMCSNETGNKSHVPISRNTGGWSWYRGEKWPICWFWDFWFLHT